MKNKRIFAVFNAKNKEIQLMDCGIYCALKFGVYHCRYTLRYWLLPFQRSHSAMQCVFVLGGTKGDSLFSIYTLTLSSLCQEQKVSGPPKSTVSAILRQQRDSLHRIRNSRSRECQIRGTRISSGSPSASSSSSIMRSTSASSISTGRRSVFRSSSPPPE